MLRLQCLRNHPDGHGRGDGRSSRARLGWHPLLRIQRRTTLAPDGRERCPAGALVRSGEAWVGRGRLGRPKGRRLTVTLVAAWTTAQEEPWVVVTDLPPARPRAPPAPRAGARPRRISLVRLGIQWLRHLLARGRLWRRLWLAPEPWPQPPPGLAITIHGQEA